MWNLRNPFGIRDGQIITIGDLTENEKGLSCNCLCPSCKAPFEARLGKKRTHHFAHSGAGCDEEIAYLNGLYLLLKEYVETGNTICLPELFTYFRTNLSISFTEENFFENIWFRQQSSNDYAIRCSDELEVTFDSAEIVFSGNRPNAILLQKGNSNLAIVIKPPDTVCKEMHPKRYKDFATLILDFSDYDYLLSSGRKTDIFEQLHSKALYYWIYSPKAISFISKVNEINEQYKTQFRKREEERKQEELRRKEEQKKREDEFMRRQEERALALCRSSMSQHSISEVPPAPLPPTTKSQSTPRPPMINGREMIMIKRMDYDQPELIRDSTGFRWIKCRICQRSLRVDHAFSYEKDTNYGICKDCVSKKHIKRTLLMI